MARGGLYDNAQLLRVYVHLWQVAGRRPGAETVRHLAERVVRETADFLLGSLRTACVAAPALGGSVRLRPLRRTTATS